MIYARDFLICCTAPGLVWTESVRGHNAVDTKLEKSRDDCAAATSLGAVTDAQLSFTQLHRPRLNRGRQKTAMKIMENKILNTAHQSWPYTHVIWSHKYIATVSTTAAARCDGADDGRKESHSSQLRQICCALSSPPRYASNLAYDGSPANTTALVCFSGLVGPNGRTHRVI